MSFTPRKYKDIYDEMRSLTSVVTDFEVGSVARTMYETFAFEMALLYEKMNLVYLSAYVDTATGNQLDQVVAVLGIQRSQPDYAEGIVSFQRDGAGQEIIIPIGTLVATEESSTGEKKVYVTAKEATLAANKTVVEVNVRGFDRGEEFETAADTIVVMPRPVPGVKFVNNDAPIRLVGKRRETDDELRERAKNALISSGKASAIAIENALLSLSGVRDARVKENFEYAQGQVDITNNNLVEITIPNGTIIIVDIGSGQLLRLRTLDPVVYTNSDTVPTTKTVRVEQTMEGLLGEYTLGGFPATYFEAVSNVDFGLQLMSGLSMPQTLDYHEQVKGVIEVYVDSPRYHDGTDEERAAEEARLVAAVEKVRAAGILSVVKPSGRATVSAVFKIDIAGTVDLSTEERREFEVQLEEIITNFMNQLRMGENLLYGKLIKELLSVTNVENLSDFKGTITRVDGTVTNIENFEFAQDNKFIGINAFERVQPRHICVATEDKQLKVHVAYMAMGLNQGTADLIRAALESYFAGKNFGDAANSGEIETVIDVTSVGTYVGSTTELRAETWSPGPDNDPRVLLVPATGGLSTVTTYVERPVLGTLFGYKEALTLVGAVKLIMPLNVTQADQVAAEASVSDAIDQLVVRLGPEESLTFEAVKAAAETVSGVLAAEVDSDDFLALLGTVQQPTQLTNKTVDVLPFQRAFGTFIAVSNGVKKLHLSLGAIDIEIANTTTSNQRDDVQAAVANAFNNVLAGFEVGEDITYPFVKSALENLVVGVPYSIVSLQLNATSLVDGWTQSITSNSVPLHVRSIELPVVSPLTSSSDITLTLV